MEKRIKYFFGDPLALQRDVNVFLRETEGALHDVKIVQEEGYLHGVLVYTPKKDSNGKEKS